MADNVTYAMSKVAAATASDMNGRPAAGKTGTWKLRDTSDNARPASAAAGKGWDDRCP
ncbi:hypothetical protein Daura_31120 [Dactylosporangium aurantiacum]|uniref:Uncharacterized protein n=1 Tax=Dactylosporangium aurantiacum TaxID=35754 RepID=A0A9Q9IB74_9ACTN|nr:hypothetical protein [Dactylosporangium aurantiacum]MDG6107269.1 hypothetical protein [Dactylosporangium aurantiacum]UWZ51200.1 hypothetical protein Daura_31120 [Dactylosporangium aurantiacum]